MVINIKKFPSINQKSYDSVRGDIRSGDILLCSGSTLFSRLIQKATNSVWSHVALVIRIDSIDRIMVLESVESIGVRTVPLSHYIRNYGGDGQGYPGKLLLARHIDFESVVDEKRLHKMSRFAVDLFGYPYDKDEILRIASRIGKKFLGFSKSEIKRDREFICSEYAWQCFHSVGIDIAYN